MLKFYILRKNLHVSFGDFCLEYNKAENTSTEQTNKTTRWREKCIKKTRNILASTPTL